jgi:serine/threonine protein phosphatase PrpC
MSENIEEKLYLNDPHTAKELDHGESFAFGGMQGWRKSNEDFHKHLIPINRQSWKLWSYFAIFDGHNGLPYIHFFY